MTPELRIDKGRRGLNVVPLDKEQSEMLVKLIMLDHAAKAGKAKVPNFEEIKLSKDGKDGDMPFLSEIVYRRIVGMKLPVRMSFAALMSVSIFCDRPGAAIVMLMDVLSEFAEDRLKDYDAKDQFQVEVLNTVVEAVEVSLDDICIRLYPMGFYNMDELGDYVDKHIKTNEDPWSIVYNVFEEKRS
jgi:hypothetical protein